MILQPVGASVAEAAAWSVPTPAKETIAKRHTLKQLRDQYVVKQQLDYSCGAAALATLMVYYYGENTSEKEILELLNTRLQTMSEEDRARKTSIGFSLLDLKVVAQQKGYQAAGFKLSVDQLPQLLAPVLVHLRPLGYYHFAVLRGVAGDRVYLADPARGNLRMSIERFLDEWHGLVFVLGKAGEEKITHYPLALSRGTDYPSPTLHQAVQQADQAASSAVNLVLRARPR
ncbi:MAG: C39 family peptidase [Gammaproteobacteria bacterium]|nr:C39 family peptidase [Gammaproteobacteria bacterium]